MNRQDEAELLSKVRADAERVAAAFGLSYRAIVAEHPRVKSRYGACYADGLITIRLKHAKTGEPLKYSSLIDTVCHELAHLRHFNHGPQFKAFFLKILSWAREQGIYCPGPRGQAPSLGPFVPSAEAMAVALRPPRRNGVPVFPQPPASDDRDTPLLPWERLQATMAAPSAAPRSITPAPRSMAPAPRSAPAAPQSTLPAPRTLPPAPRPSRPTKRSAPQQLTLF